MSAVSEEEKRRLLRERRAAKLNKNASSRLEKITGSTNSFLPTETPVSRSSTASSASTSAPSSSTFQDDAARKKSNRISQTFSTPVDSLHGDADPEINDLSEFIKKNSSSSVQDEPMPDMDQLLKGLFGGQGHQHLGGGGGSASGFDGSDATVPGMEELMKAMSMFSNFPDPSGEQPSDHPQQQQQQATFEEMDYYQKVELYNQQEAKKFKFQFTFLRFFIITLLYHTSFFDFTSLPIMSIWDKFLLVDLAFMSYYFFYISTNANYKSESWIYTGVNFISGLLGPGFQITKYLKIVAKYNELFGLFVTDFSFLVVLFVLTSILS